MESINERRQYTLRGSRLGLIKLCLAIVVVFAAAFLLTRIPSDQHGLIASVGALCAGTAFSVSFIPCGPRLPRSYSEALVLMPSNLISFYAQSASTVSAVMYGWISASQWMLDAGAQGIHYFVIASIFALVSIVSVMIALLVIYWTPFIRPLLLYIRSRRQQGS